MAKKPTKNEAPAPTTTSEGDAPTHGGYNVGDTVMMGTRPVRVVELVPDGRLVCEYGVDADPRNPLSKGGVHRVPLLPQHVTKAK